MTFKTLNKENIRVILLLIATALFVFCGPAQAQTDSITKPATVQDLLGYATVKNASGEKSRLQKGSKVEDGDIIETGKDSAINLLLPNGKIVHIGADQLVAYSKHITSSLPYAALSGGRLSKGTTNSLSTAISAGGSPIQ